MLVLEYKLIGNPTQEAAMEEAIRTATFIRNKCLRLWLDGEKVGEYDLSAYCVPLSQEFAFAGKLNAQARQAAAERAWSSIARFYRECKENQRRIQESRPARRIASPKFKKRGRSVEYKTTGWKLSEDRRFITFTDGCGIGRLKLLDKRPLNDYPLASIKRVRIVRRADGFYCQFVTDLERREMQEPTGKRVGIDVGLASFYTDSNGEHEPGPKPLRNAEKRLKRLGRRLSRKKKGSQNRNKARVKLARQHLKVARQRKDFAAQTARALVQSHDLIAYEDLPVHNLVRNHHLAKSIHDAGWSAFLGWVAYYGKVFGRITVAVPPAYTSQDCSVCGGRVPKGLSERTHRCECGAVLDRDHNAARNILRLALLLLCIDTGGHPGIGEGCLPNAWGDRTATTGAIPPQVGSWNQEPHRL